MFLLSTPYLTVCCSGQDFDGLIVLGRTQRRLEDLPCHGCCRNLLSWRITLHQLLSQVHASRRCFGTTTTTTTTAVASCRTIDYSRYGFGPVNNCALAWAEGLHLSLVKPTKAFQRLTGALTAAYFINLRFLEPSYW